MQGKGNTSEAADAVKGLQLNKTIACLKLPPKIVRLVLVQ